MSTSDQSPCFVGIDVAKDTFDLGIRPGGQTISCAYTDDGITTLVTHLRTVVPQLIVMEATGGLELRLVTALAAAQFPVAVVNPRQVRDFAKATGKLAKTDTIDALILAHFAEAIRPEVRPLKDDEALELTALQTRRRQLVDMLTAEKNRLSSALKWTQASIKMHIAWLEQNLQQTDKDLGQTIRKSPVWRERDQLYQSVPGVGPVMSLSILTDLPEIGSLDRRQIAALAGVAPLNRDSGKRSGTRSILAGRARFRAVLYMSALAATCFNPVIKKFYNRLIENGKPKKVALTACMRKLLTILNAMAKTNTPWQPAAA